MNAGLEYYGDKHSYKIIQNNPNISQSNLKLCW